MNSNTVLQQKKGTNSNQATKIAVAQGDGIGPEIMGATLKILTAAGANIEPEFINLGEEVYLSGNSAGIDKSAWEVIKRNKVILKAPVTTPQGKGYKSLNVTLRKSLGLFANIRPVSTLKPFIAAGHPAMDVVIVRENEEDLYAGIEHQQTQDVVQCLKLITRPGSEKIVRYAFEYARVHGRKKVTCMVKDNIMKLTDGLFHRVFKEIAAEYPDIEHDSQIIDIGSARIAARPGDYDVVVTSNLYGDIISDIVAEVAGSVGLAGSANIGSEVAMFEAIHGSAPDISGQNIANPSGLLNASVMMLNHIGQPVVAERVKRAWLATIEGGFHTADVYQEGQSKKLVSTGEFADEVISRLKDFPEGSIENVATNTVIKIKDYHRANKKKELVGVDIFIDWQGSDPNEIGTNLSNIEGNSLKLKMITNRGVKVFPHGMEETYCTDHWRCRFVSKDVDVKSKTPIYNPVSYEAVIATLAKLNMEGFDVIKTENLYEFDGKRGFSLGQGE